MWWGVCLVKGTLGFFIKTKGAFQRMIMGELMKACTDVWVGAGLVGVFVGYVFGCFVRSLFDSE